MSRLRKAPERWWASIKRKSRSSRQSSKGSRGDRHSSSSSQDAGSGGGGGREVITNRTETAEFLEICGEHYLKGIRRRSSDAADVTCLNEDERGRVARTRGAGSTCSATAGNDEQILSDEERREVVALVNDNKISMDFILEMKEAFLLFDKNGDGFISARELGVLMRTLGRNPTEEEIQTIMNEIDVDHNGKLDFSEFVIMMRDKLSGEDMEQEIRQAFRVFDRNGDGYISKQEFKHCMMHFGEQFTNEEVEEMIAEADSNNDGKIDYGEFSKMILKEIT